MISKNYILVVEDDADHFDLIQDGLRRARIVNEITRSTTAEEAISYLENCLQQNRELRPLPCLLLLDLNLPGQSGFSVLEWIRNHAELKKVPVVILTVSAADADLDKAYALGANSYLQKPFEVADFRALVKSINSYWVLLAEKPRF